MLKIKKVAIILLFLVLLSNDAFCSAAGTTVFYFLKIPQNAVQAALAGMTNFGKNSFFPNPAVVGFIDEYNISASYAAHFQNTSYHSFSFAKSVQFADPVGKVGVKVSYGGLDYGKFDGYLETPNGDYIENGTFGTNDAFVQLSLGYKIFENLSYGVGFKYIWQNIDSSRLAGVAVDISVLFCSKSSWIISGGIENIGPYVESYPLPSNLYASYTNVLTDYFNFGFELKVFTDNTMWLKGAMEINKDKMFFLRSGYSCPIENDNKTLGEWYQRNLTLGFGFNIRFISINYAWLPFGELGSTNMLSFQVRF
ncbi:MAG: hypothetical protein LBT18_00235 [Endomicrobium sp.]|jgi:hypothetical protein|nr:hypothetical protein [Endomicrobium sp.]